MKNKITPDKVDKDLWRIVQTDLKSNVPNSIAFKNVERYLRTIPLDQFYEMSSWGVVTRICSEWMEDYRPKQSGRKSKKN
jgi:hypothetical protein